MPQRGFVVEQNPLNTVNNIQFYRDWPFVFFARLRLVTIKSLRGTLMYTRASENFRGCLPQTPLKSLGQILAALAISGHFERFSPGQNGSEVGRQITLNSLTGRPTSEPFWPGENLSKWPEIARAARIWPKLFSGDWGRHPRKFSLALL